MELKPCPYCGGEAERGLNKRDNPHCGGKVKKNAVNGRHAGLVMGIIITTISSPNGKNR